VIVSQIAVIALTATTTTLLWYKTLDKQSVKSDKKPRTARKFIPDEEIDPVSPKEQRLYKYLNEKGGK
jgi:hypothetical protein